MAERRAVNKYYPPDWDPSHGSANAYVGQHPLRDRARKLNEGILIVRFELPFSIWCGGCNSMLATGLRFNAEKKKIGNYYSTPIWSFRMKCRECGHWFEIHTNPKETTYDVADGARKKAESEDDIVDLSCIEEQDNQGSLLHELEAAKEHKQKAAQQIQRLNTLQVGRKIREENQRQSDEIQSRTGINIPILPASAEDSANAAHVQFGETGNVTKRIAKEVAGRPLFAKAAKLQKPNLKTKLALRHLSNNDPFTSQSTEHRLSIPDLGIKRCSKSTFPTNGLDELALTYANMDSSSSDTD
ncbi:Protein saf4 [Coemansia brasiliensis]|uniref:Protein saf4 n=1 Tax=Coemansia brasiliensis TaxID=2650707 RepID=A0A9W8LXX6_9FUNG|nr:Protein saf4 [Coemansia brasiliensis]